MKMERLLSHRKSLSAAALLVSATMVSYGLYAPPATVAAQQQTPKGAPQPGGSAKPTGGLASGPGEGAQAVAADPAKGQQQAPPAPRRGFVA